MKLFNNHRTNNSIKAQLKEYNSKDCHAQILTNNIFIIRKGTILKRV